MIKFEIEGTNMKRGKVARHGTAGHIYLPKDWIGKEVIVILVE